MQIICEIINIWHVTGFKDILCFMQRNICEFLEQGFFLNIGTNLEWIFIVHLVISLDSLQGKSLYLAVNTSLLLESPHYSRCLPAFAIFAFKLASENITKYFFNGIIHCWTWFDVSFDDSQSMSVLNSGSIRCYNLKRKFFFSLSNAMTDTNII